jgi:hypothetical protein
MKIGFFKLSVLLPVIIGFFSGAMLFWVGYSEDGPGACVLGLALFFGMAMFALRNACVVKPGFLAPILLFCYAVGVAALDVLLFLEGEFDSIKALAAVFVLAAVMVAVGVALLYRRRQPGRGAK